MHSFVAGAIALVLVACGGGSESTKPDPKPDDPPPGVPAKTEPTDAEKFQAAHYRACDAMCSLLTRCSQVELRVHWDELSPEEQKQAEQIGPEHLKAHTNQCVGGCQDSEVSVRQVKVIRECVQGMPVEGEPEDDQCHAYFACLDKAQKSS